jgi:hypothetical protein
MLKETAVYFQKLSERGFCDRITVRFLNCLCSRKNKKYTDEFIDWNKFIQSDPIPQCNCMTVFDKFNFDLHMTVVGSMFVTEDLVQGVQEGDPLEFALCPFGVKNQLVQHLIHKDAWGPPQPFFGFCLLLKKESEVIS